MDLPFSPTFTPFSPPYETLVTTSPSTFPQFLPHDDVIFPALVPQQQQQQPQQQQQKDVRKKTSSLSSLQPPSDQKTEDINQNDSKKKKIVHREVERQRRSEMSSLHASLRTLLPHDYIRGKRAMSDHLDEAVKYIRDLEQNINALKDQRDRLKNKVSIDKTPKSKDREVKVKWSKGGGGGLEVNLRTTSNCEEVEENDDNNIKGLQLSNVLQCLIQEGFEIVSCISHRVDNSTLFHCIQAQAEDGRMNTTNALKLQQKLEAL